MTKSIEAGTLRTAGWLNRWVGAGLSCMAMLALGACTVLPAAGPSTRAVHGSVGQEQGNGVPTQLVDVTSVVAQQIRNANVPPAFATSFGDGTPIGLEANAGDILDISIWEAPPAALFGTLSGGGLASSASGALATARSSALPEQMINANGTIVVPFAGTIRAAGRTPQEIAADIRARLIGKAHDPQVIVRVSRNAGFNVTIVGEVANSGRMPLTAKGERLLDALANAGGVRQPVGKMTIQLTRGQRVDAMPLEAVIKDPRQNIRLQADDVVTLLFQPYSFTVLGAARNNQEIPFEATGLTLSQALGRMGGLDDQRANPKGVFIFRFEDPKVFSPTAGQLPATPDGKVPVIYRVNMRDPSTLFVAQSFLIKDKDVIYISNAPLADFSKFLQAVSQIVYPIAVIQTTNIF